MYLHTHITVYECIRLAPVLACRKRPRPRPGGPRRPVGPTCSRTGRRAAWCSPCGSRAASCTCRVPGARSRGGSCPWRSLLSRRAIALSLVSGPAEENKFSFLAWKGISIDESIESNKRIRVGL